MLILYCNCTVLYMLRRKIMNGLNLEVWDIPNIFKYFHYLQCADFFQGRVPSSWNFLLPAPDYGAAAAAAAGSPVGSSGAVGSSIGSGGSAVPPPPLTPHVPYAAGSAAAAAAAYHPHHPHHPGYAAVSAGKLMVWLNYNCTKYLLWQ